MDPIEITIAGITIMEPPTAITDLFVTVVCFISFIKLNQQFKKNQKYEQQFLYFFVFMGLCTLCGGVMTHAFPYAFHHQPLVNAANNNSIPWTDKIINNYHNLPNWLCNICSVTFFAFAMVNRADYLLKLQNKKKFYIAIIVETIVILIATIYKCTFIFAEIHIGIVLLIFSAPLQIIIYKKLHKKDSYLILLGTLITLLVAPVMINKEHFSPWFNHNDICHLLIGTTMIVFYFAATKWINEYETDNNADLEKPSIIAINK